MPAALAGEGETVLEQGLRQFGGREGELLQTLFDRVEGAVGRAGFGEAVRAQQQRRAVGKAEPADRRGFGGEFGETERDAGVQRGLVMVPSRMT